MSKPQHGATRHVAPAKRETPKKPTDEEILARSYHKPFLSKVVVRADFAAPMILEENQLPKELRSKLLKDFPLLDIQRRMEKEIHADEESVKTTTHVYPVFAFANSGKTNQVVLAFDNLALTFGKYPGYTKLRAQFLSTLDLLLKEFPETQFKRLGLRYVDKITLDEPNPTDWSAYLEPELLGSFEIADNQATIARAFHVVEFNYGDFKMRFQYGMSNPDFPAPIRQKVFTLDYDAYIEELIERSDIEKLIDKFHDKLKLSFEEVITDALRAKMGVAHA